jgi:hypothetical protein
LLPALGASILAYAGYLTGSAFSGPLEVLAFVAAFLAGAAVVWCADALAQIPIGSASPAVGHT